MKPNKFALFCIASFAVIGTIFSLSAPLLFVAYLDEGIIAESAIGLLSSLNLLGLVIGSLLSLYWWQRIPLLKLAQPITLLIAIIFSAFYYFLGGYVFTGIKWDIYFSVGCGL